MIVAASQRFDEYMVIIFAPLVLVFALPGILKYRKERKERNEWLKDDITRHND